MAKYAANRKKKIQRRNSQLVEMKNQDRAAMLGLSESVLSDSQIQPAKLVRTDLGNQGISSQFHLDLSLRHAIW